jgi:alpha-ribazole phosphatase
MDAHTRSRIILIRHGQTTSNEAKLLSGHTDPPLTELGRAQAQGVAEMLKDVKIDRAFSSPFQRTLDTAAPLLEGRGLELETHDGIKEQNFGDWEEKSFTKIFEMIPGGPDKLLRGPFLTRFPAGEGTEDFVARVMKSFRDVIVPGSEGKTTAVFTHSGVITILMCHFFGIDPFLNFFRIKIENASVSCVDRYEAGLYHIQYVNRTYRSI